MITHDETGFATISISLKESRGIQLAAIGKKHQWQRIKDIIGAKRCSRCGMLRFKMPGTKAIYARDGRVDESSTKQNCFILSKD